jgi:spore maturation protein CgeB
MDVSVLVVGSNRPGNLESSYLRAFKALGCIEYFWDSTEALHRVARGYGLGRLLSTFINVEPWLRKANLELLRLADKSQPRLIVVIGTENVRAGTLGQLRAQLPDTLIYCLFPDTPHNLVPDRIQCLPMFDRVITVSPGWMDSFSRLGARRVSYLPLAADADLHHPLANGTSTNDTCEVAFIGNWRPEREVFLEQLVDFDLRIWGSDYWKRHTKRGSILVSKWGGRPLIGEEFAWGCAQTSVMLNIIDGVGWPGPNMRVFELAACGAFSLVTRTPAIVELFEEGKNIECFDTVAEAREKIKFYIQNEQARKQIANRSYDFVLNEGHTYVDRAKQLLDWAVEDGMQ